MKRKRMPPVPPKNRNPKGAGSDPDPKIANPVSQETQNEDQVGDHANIRQNTSNQQDQR
jgi:hypothetical protein